MLSNPGGNNLANVTESFQGLSQQLAQVPNNLFPAISGKLPDICFANFSKGKLSWKKNGKKRGHCPYGAGGGQPQFLF